MNQILITSTVLIVVILLARLILRKRVSKRLIYATWLLVALRLLIPIQFGQSEYSVVAVTEQLAQDSEPIQQVQQSFREPVAGPSREELYQQLMQDYLAQTQESVTTPQPEVTAPSAQQPSVTPEVHAQIQQEVEEQIAVPTLGQILNGIWISGMVLMAGWFLITNLLFLRRAKKDAIPCTDVIAPVRIRISPNVSTPCLAGLIRPVIYLTPASAGGSQTRNHVLTHELTHLRHLDHIWAWIRCVCLCIYWFDPLVWVAAIVSKRDCELACDEAALRKLGDSERIAYGKTLLATVTHSPARVLQTATAMSETKKQLKERVNFIVKKPKNLLIAAVCLILTVALTAGLVFTGCKSEPDNSPTGTPSATISQEPAAPEQPDSPSEPPTEETMLQLLQQATDIVANNESIKLDPYPIVKGYLMHQNSTLTHSQALTITDESIIIHIQLSPGFGDWTDVYVYAVFLDLLLDRYADDVTARDIIPPHLSSSGIQSNELFLYTGWQDAGYHNIKDYYAAIIDGTLKTPPEAFYISCERPQVRSAQSNFSDNLCDQVFPPVVTTPAESTESLEVAKRAIDDYLWYKVLGVCCDYEYVNADMSEYLTAEQKTHYYNIQYKLKCCGNIPQVSAHIDRTISTTYRTNGYPDDRLFSDDAGNIYLIVVPTDYNGYRHIEVLSQSSGHITARACIYDEDGCYSNQVFTLLVTTTGYQITEIEEDKDYHCEERIIDQGTTYMVIKYGTSFYGYRLNDQQGKLKVNEHTDYHCPTVTPISEHITEIMINYGPGITQRTYWNTQTLTRSEPYDYVIAVSNGKIAYLDGELDRRTLVVCDIFDRSTAQTFTDLGIYADVMPVIDATFSGDSTQLEISYYTAKDTEKTITLDLAV